VQVGGIKRGLSGAPTPPSQAGRRARAWHPPESLRRPTRRDIGLSPWVQEAELGARCLPSRR